MTRGWGLWDRIGVLVRLNGGLRLAELSEQTGEPVAAVKAAAWAMCRVGKLDFCSPYFTLPAPAKAPVRRAA